MIKNHPKTKDDNPEYIMNLALGYQASQILSAAINLDIFTILESGAKNISEITLHLEADEGALIRFSNALVSLNLLEKKNGRLHNTKISSQYLVKGKKKYLGNAIHHGSNLWDSWKGLDDQIRSGEGRRPNDEQLREYPHRLKDYLSAMDDFAELKADMISDVLSIKKYSKMLDLACGRGAYSLTFASQNSKLHCTLVDLEPNIVYTRELIHKSRYRNRISIQACQILEDEIPGYGYDLIFISNLIHAYSELEVKKILGKAWDKAAKNSEIVIHDYILDDSGHGPRNASLFDLNMFVGTPKGKCYTMFDIKRLFDSLGAKSLKMIPIGLGSSLAIGVK